MNKTDFDTVSSRYPGEVSSESLYTSPTWVFPDSNEFSNFGAQLAGMRGGHDLEIVSVSGSAKTYTASKIITGELQEGSILFARGFKKRENDGPKHVTGVVGNTITVSESLVDETVFPVGSAIVFQIAQVLGKDEASIIAPPGEGMRPRLNTRTFDLTTLFLVPRQWVYIGGDGNPTHQFNITGNNGLKRILFVSPHELVFDRSFGDMETEDGAGKSIVLFIGTQTLDAPDMFCPTRVQAEGSTKAPPGEFTLDVPQAEKIALKLSFTALDAGRKKAGFPAQMSDECVLRLSLSGFGSAAFSAKIGGQ